MSTYFISKLNLCGSLWCLYPNVDFIKKRSNQQIFTESIECNCINFTLTRVFKDQFLQLFHMKIKLIPLLNNNKKLTTVVLEIVEY